MRKVFLYCPFEVDVVERELPAVVAAGFVPVADRSELVAGEVTPLGMR